MPRAASTLDLFACALVCALGCGPSAPPNAPPPAGNTPSSVALDAPPPPPSLIDDCAAGKLDDAATAMLVQRLSATHELKGERCFVRALQDYRPDVTEETVALAAQAVGELKLKAAAGPLFEVFTKIKASKPHVAST